MFPHAQTAWSLLIRLPPKWCIWLSKGHQTGKLGAIPSRLCRRLEKWHLRPIKPRAWRWWVVARIENCLRAIMPLTCQQCSMHYHTKAVTWPKAQASGDGRRRPLVTLPQEWERFMTVVPKVGGTAPPWGRWNRNGRLGGNRRPS